MDGDTGTAALAVRPVLDQEQCLVALTAYAAGDVLHRFGARECLPAATYLSVQVDAHQHIHLSPRLLQYINHGCDPNVYFDIPSSCVICLRDIQPGEEITFFYPSTEWTMSRPFRCRCGAASCLGVIQGAAHISAATLASYRLAPHIVALLASSEDSAFPVPHAAG